MLPVPIELPSQIPVMVLPNCNLLPHGLLPLYIFEPRYRQMLADALESNRMFAIGTVDPDGDLDPENPEVLPYSCAGMVRACVGAEDGTSHLVLQGLQRIHFADWPETEKPYRVAEISPMPTSNENAAASTALLAKALEAARELIDSGQAASTPAALDEMESLDNPEQLADLIAYHLIRDPLRRQRLLEISDLGERLRFILTELVNAGPNLP